MTNDTNIEFIDSFLYRYLLHLNLMRKSYMALHPTCWNKIFNPQTFLDWIANKQTNDLFHELTSAYDSVCR